jgi:hypothetical protein
MGGDGREAGKEEGEVKGRCGPKLLAGSFLGPFLVEIRGK